MSMNRRAYLKGLGVTLGLPLFDSLGWADNVKVKPPVRLGFMYMPHGVIMDQFWPATAESYLASPPPALQSLRPVLDQCLMVKGIAGVPIAPFNGAPHALELSTWLTATLPAADKRNEINIAISADQIAANHVGAFTALPSLELATMPQTWKENQEGLNEGYYSHCSFSSPTQAVPAEVNPRNVLHRLFNKQDQAGGGARGDASPLSKLDRSLLDIVLGGARDLRRTLPVSDQRKLDEYLDSVRSVERRIAAIEARQKDAALEKAGVRASKRDASDSPPIEIRIPEGEKRSEYMQVMCDLNVLAFQTDTTRVSTYIGSTPIQLGLGAATYFIGRAKQSSRLTTVGAQLFRAELLSEGLTFGIKQSVRRNRPEGSGFAFPSGHTTVSFASATVLQQNYGWRVGAPAYALASFVALSRVQMKRHYLSDVAFGAALGIAAGRTVAFGPSRRIVMTPTVVDGGGGVQFVWKK